MKVNIIDNTYLIIDKFTLNYNLQDSISYIKKVYSGSRIECGNGMINVYIKLI